MLLPAAKAGATLRIACDLDERLHAGLERILAIASAYWGFPGAEVVASGLARRQPSGDRAMFFSGGIDSFYTLQQRRAELDRLVLVGGFVIPTGDAVRFAEARRWVDAVGREVGLRSSAVEVSLREHKVFDSAPWEVTHGGALAAVAHALAPTLSRVYIASSDTPAPWGSRPHLDPLWSSGAVEIVSDGEPRKIDKVAKIAHWPLVHRYLRVCYANLGSSMNCGRCRKCVRTQLMFDLYGAREKLQTFPQLPLPELIDGLPSLDGQDPGIWTELIERLHDRTIMAAVGRFVRRRPTPIERVAKRTQWMRRSAAGRWMRRAGKRLLARRRRG